MEGSDKISVCSYNVHGYNTGSPFLKELCGKNDIIFVQEHWLQKSQLHTFNSINDRSATILPRAFQPRTIQRIVETKTELCRIKTYSHKSFVFFHVDRCLNRK